MYLNQFVIIQDNILYLFSPWLRDVGSTWNMDPFKKRKKVKFFLMMLEFDSAADFPALTAGLWCLLPRHCVSLTFCSCGANNTLPGIHGSNLKRRKVVGGKAVRVNVLVKFFTKEATLFGKKIWVFHAVATARPPSRERRSRNVELTCSCCNSRPIYLHNIRVVRWNWNVACLSFSKHCNLLLSIIDIHLQKLMRAKRIFNWLF